ncbi:MAG: hypothetical protein ACXV8K_14855 [Ilumatobacteraceae bacterium]
MIHLDEREQSFDAMLRAAGVRLRDNLAHSAVPAFRAPRLTHRRRWAIVVAVAIVVIVGLVAIGTNRNDRSLGNDPASLRWLVEDLPAGWKATGAFDAGTSEINQRPSLINLYATRDPSKGPLLFVQGSMGIKGQGVAPGQTRVQTNYQETKIGDRRAVFADDPSGRVLYVDIDGHWVLLKVRNITDAQLSDLGRSVVLKDDESAEIPAAALVDGLQLVAPASASIDSMILPRTGTTVAASIYNGGVGGHMTLAVGRPHPAVLAFAELSYTLEPVKIGSASGFVGSAQVDTDSPLTVRMAYWERERLAFILTGQGVSQADLLTAAESVAPAGTTPAVEVGAATTDVPFTGEPHDVAVDVAVSDVSANEQQWSGTLPTGETWSVHVVRLYDSVTLSTRLNGANQSFGSGPIPRLPGEEIGCCGPTNVITADPKASALRVLRHNGDRYTIPLHDLPGTAGLRIALIALPDSGPQGAELIDADGNVLETLPGGG